MREGIPATQRQLASPEESAWPGGEQGRPLAVLTPATRPPQARTESQLESPSARRGGADFCLGGAGRWGRELGKHPLQPPPPDGGDKGGTTETALGARPRATPGTGVRKGVPKSAVPRNPTRSPPFPARSLTGATFFRAAQNTRSRRTAGDPAQLS